MMTWQLAAEDAVLYVFLIAGASVYGLVLGQKAGNRSEQSTEGPRSMSSTRIRLKFQQYTILMISGWMVSGVLYQSGVISTVVAVILFAVSTILSALGLIRLRQYIN
ncbi:hypothetical protein [Alicyclobacillus sp. ALC3]|uniref:hypothetical protein n=1 Tax=Alicyclobacillus sp. ALC3 TaxID=2796143 RepID=UPI002379B8D2|nr:hypothetical protein [Alicyclobacillus sp. ALC3]WDL97127.1 hypothetical protein JC200_23170 [Alicyclobacillus sp. ALC3]